jgi:hypothetical protein
MTGGFSTLLQHIGAKRLSKQHLKLGARSFGLGRGFEASRYGYPPVALIDESRIIFGRCARIEFSDVMNGNGHVRRFAYGG